MFNKTRRHDRERCNCACLMEPLEGRTLLSGNGNLQIADLTSVAIDPATPTATTMTLSAAGGQTASPVYLWVRDVTK